MSTPPTTKPMHGSIILICTRCHDTNQLRYQSVAVYNRMGSFYVSQCGYKVPWNRVIRWWYLTEGI